MRKIAKKRWEGATAAQKKKQGELMRAAKANKGAVDNRKKK